MSDFLIPLFAVTVIMALLFTVLLFNGICKIWRLSSFSENKEGWFIGVIVSIALFTYLPIYWKDSVDLDDLQISTGVLGSRIKQGESYFTMSSNGDDKKYWDFNHCGGGSSISRHCKGKQITVWHKDNVVYQVEMNGQVIYSIENSNYRILIHNLIDLILYIFVAFLMPIMGFAVGPHVRELREMKMREEFEEKLTNETLDEDHSGKILRRFCKNCSTELGMIVENRSASNNLMDIKYEQYKFCVNCGLDSDTSMPIKGKEYYNSGLLGSTILIFLALVIPSAIVVTIATDFILMALATLAFLFVLILVIGDPTCPRCGRMYEKEHFCPNYGLDLKTR